MCEVQGAMAEATTARDKNVILQHLRRLLEERPEICFGYVHGSFLTSSSYNDVDVALYLVPAPGEPFDYEMQVSVELTRALRFPIDVHVLNDARLGFQHQSLRGQLILTRDPVFLTTFIERVAGQYMEFAYYQYEYLVAVTT